MPGLIPVRTGYTKFVSALSIPPLSVPLSFNDARTAVLREIRAGMPTPGVESAELMRAAAACWRRIFLPIGTTLHSIVPCGTGLPCAHRTSRAVSG